MASMDKIDRFSAVTLKRGVVADEREFAVDEEFDLLEAAAFAARRGVADGRDGSAFWADAGEAPSTDYLLLF